MTNEQTRVKQWMQKAKLDFPAKPEIRSLEDRMVCARLLIEECFETIEFGLGLRLNAVVDDCGANHLGPIKDVSFEETGAREVDLVELADGLGDLKYVANYTANKHGIDLEPVETEVSRSNDSKWLWTREELEKAAEQGWTVQQINDSEYCVTDKTGKIRKPSTYSPANISPIIEAQCV